MIGFGNTGRPSWRQPGTTPPTSKGDVKRMTHDQAVAGGWTQPQPIRSAPSMGQAGGQWGGQPQGWATGQGWGQGQGQQQGGSPVFRPVPKGLMPEGYSGADPRNAWLAQGGFQAMVPQPTNGGRPWEQLFPVSAGQPAQNNQQIQTSIQPQGVYPGGYVNAAGNLAQALLAPAWGDAAAGRAMPGVSLRSPMSQYGMGIDWARGLGNAAAARPAAMQPLEIANQQNILAGQQAREQEALGWGRLGTEGLSNSLMSGLAQQGSLLQLLTQLTRGWF